MQVTFTPIRVVCHNTLTQALARGFTHTVRHDRDLWSGLRDVQEALGFITREYDALAQAFKWFALVRLDEEALRERVALPRRQGQPGDGHRRHAEGGLQRRYRAGRSQRGPARRLESCWFGTGFRTKVRAWEAAVKAANAKGQRVTA